MASRIRMKFIVDEYEFFHTFTPYSSMLLMYGNPNSPFSTQLCRSQFGDEIFRHAIEQKQTLPLFKGLNWNPDTWLTDLAQKLDTMEYVWVEQPVAVVHPFGHLEPPQQSSADDDEDWN